MASNFLPALDVKPLTLTFWPARILLTCESVSVLPASFGKILNPQPAVVFQVPSGCFSLRLVEHCQKVPVFTTSAPQRGHLPTGSLFLGSLAWTRSERTLRSASPGSRAAYERNSS